ncbi:probable transmembrane ascorbate ferrireductase 4 isoform X1 [Nymphaea colorata]|nr:probable transmembrane ascorbate ferrireductase 4 isoform X1 [Nymphaea colorata]
MDKGTVCSPSSTLTTAALKSKENKRTSKTFLLGVSACGVPWLLSPSHSMLCSSLLDSHLSLWQCWCSSGRSDSGHPSCFLLPPRRTQSTVLHPLVMVIGFILVSGEAILIHKALPSWSRNFKKSLHLFLQAVALGLGFFGIWIKFYKYKGFANFYSLHSWMGLICMCLFVSQWIVGFMSFWHRGEVRGVRVYVLPWHVFVGLYTYALSVATAETGLLEKLTFLQGKGQRVGRRSIPRKRKRVHAR